MHEIYETTTIYGIGRAAKRRMTMENEMAVGRTYHLVQ
jgi:hypothetical protein